MAIKPSLAAFVPLLIWTGYAIADGQNPGGAPSTCSSPTTSSLVVSLRSQQASMWCWAASGQMIMEYLGKSITQCSQANDRFGRGDCCTHPTSSACDRGNWPDWQRYGFTFHKTTNAPLTWDFVTAQLAPKDQAGHCNFEPFAFTWRWTDGSGHMMVATGYQLVNNVRWLEIEDPLPRKGFRRMTYDEYVSGDDHTHWNDFYDISKSQ